MALAQPPPFELGLRPVEWRLAVMLAALAQRETTRAGKNLVDMLGVVGPVGRNVERAAVREPVGNELDERILHDAALVVALLGPRVWKVEVDARQRSVRDLLLQDLDRIVHDDAQVVDAGLGGFQETVPDARFVDLDADEVPVRTGDRLFDQRLAVAEADLEHDGCGASEDRVKVEQPLVVIDAVGRPEFVQRALLRGCDATRAADKAANAAFLRVRFFHGRASGRQLD